MIFSPDLCEAILERRKTITRRPVKSDVCRYRAGHTYAVQPGRGKKAIAWIHVLDVRRETLRYYTYRDEAEREGFSTRDGFRDRWIELYGAFDPAQPVWRIEFELISEPAEEET